MIALLTRQTLILAVLVTTIQVQAKSFLNYSVELLNKPLSKENSKIDLKIVDLNKHTLISNAEYKLGENTFVASCGTLFTDSGNNTGSYENNSTSITVCLLYTSPSPRD